MDKRIHIVLMGYPGVGKYTIAKELVKGKDKFRLIDNHLVNDPLFYTAGDMGEHPPKRFWENAGKIRDALFDMIEHVSEPDLSFVFTGVIADDETDREWFAKLENIARARDAVFVPVILKCDAAENDKRLTTEARQNSFKLSDVHILHKLHNRFKIYEPDHPNRLVLDVTQLSPEQARDAIMKHCQTCCA